MARTLPKYEAVKKMSSRFSLNRETTRQLLGISESTQFRYEKHNPTLKPAIADRFERLQRITQQALALFEDEGETQHWLSTPKAALGGKSPLDALANDAGAKKVEELLYRAEYGIFS
jgi:putative toxin-antitoxin system antitoxin component (TIGR02293 family)